MRTSALSAALTQVKARFLAASVPIFPACFPACFLVCVFLCVPVTPAQTPPPSHLDQRAAESTQLDINTATADRLRALPGMGVAYARRVIDNRPYTAKNQLVTRGILPQTVYDGIRDRIIAHHVAAER